MSANPQRQKVLLQRTQRRIVFFLRFSFLASFMVYCTYKLSFVVSLIILGDLGNDHIFAMVKHSAGSFEEHERERWQLPSRFTN